MSAKRARNYNCLFMQAGRISGPGCLLLVMAMILLFSAAMADLYWCQTGPNRSSLVEQPIEDAECRLVSKDPNPPQEQQQSTTPRQQGQAKDGIDQARLEGFPRISDTEQLQRDQTRGSILHSELSGEVSEFQKVRTLIDSQDFVLASPEVQEYYKTRLRRHALNIQALRQEIARLQ